MVSLLFFSSFSSKLLVAFRNVLFYFQWEWERKLSRFNVVNTYDVQNACGHLKLLVLVLIVIRHFFPEGAG